MRFAPLRSLKAGPGKLYPKIVISALLGPLLLSGLFAQVQNYGLFQQLQQRNQSAPAGTTGQVPDYCSEPENVARPECSETLQNQTLDNTQTQPLRRYPVAPGTQFPPSDQREYQQYGAIPFGARTPEPPTEFQRYVESAVGRLLPIYGTWLFDRVPTTFAPVDRIPVTPDYTVGPGDEIDIRVWGQITLNQRLTVDRAGDIFIPQAGPISVAGLKFSQLHDAIRSAIGRVFHNFDLNVNMGQLRSIQVFVVGQARRPGSYTVSSLSTLVNTLFASGGPSALGSMRTIALRRASNTVSGFDLYDLLLRGDKSKDVSLMPGDVIFIPNAGPRVAVFGSVAYPAIYETKEGATLGEILKDAGGLSPVASETDVTVERIGPGSQVSAQTIHLTREGLATPLRNGDLIRVLPLVPRFHNTVTLRGNLADPGRFPWHAGMKISDLIPNRESLLTRDYWRERNRLISEEQEQDLKLKERAHERQSREETFPPSPQPQNPLVSPTTPDQQMQLRTGYALNPATGQPAAPYREESRNLTNDQTLAAVQSRSDVPPVRQFTWKNDVQPPAPDIDWNYAVIERIDPSDFTSRLLPFNLGKAVIEHDAAADLALEPGDIVTIFSNADVSVPRSQQTKYIRLEGEIKMAGVYSVGPGETLRDVVARAGGLTPHAYLYGTQFTRESARREQQKRYNDFLDELEREVNQGAANLSGVVVSADRAAVAQTSISGQRTMIDRLRQHQASGRIVLDLEPDSRDLSTIPALPLENGDRLYVPSRPSTVSVVGTVYNQASFIFGSDLRLGDYLLQAGGPTRFADKAHMFVIRADGSVVARNGRSGLFTRSFDALPLYPGDTLVVPTQVNKSSFMRSLIDWSQVISNFGLGAAAVNVIR
jgi:protein involved in polysaccharide export with SLBB domain